LYEYRERATDVYCMNVERGPLMCIVCIEKKGHLCVLYEYRERATDVYCMNIERGPLMCIV
jgi:hypothetical protein